MHGFAQNWNIELIIPPLELSVAHVPLPPQSSPSDASHPREQYPPGNTMSGTKPPPDTVVKHAARGGSAQSLAIAHGSPTSALPGVEGGGGAPGGVPGGVPGGTVASLRVSRSPSSASHAATSVSDATSTTDTARMDARVARPGARCLGGRSQHGGRVTPATLPSCGAKRTHRG